MNDRLLLLELLFVETSNKEVQSKAFKDDLKRNNPKLYKDLESQAILAINAVKRGEKPKHNVDNLKTLFSWNPEFDPLVSGDTYGVRAFITALVGDNRSAGKVKRFYDRTIDQYFKQVYGKTIDSKSKKKKSLVQQTKHYKPPSAIEH
jgi:hypothetical protein